MNRVALALIAAFLALDAGAQVKRLMPGTAGAPTESSATAPLAAPPGAKSVGSALDCLLAPYMEVDVGSPIDGVLETVAVDRGDFVQKGQVVAKLRSGVEAAAVEVSRARIEFSRRKVERNETLYQKQLISEQERDEMVTESRLQEQELKRELEVLKLRTITSPINGIVVERRLVPGELTRADKSVVLKLAQINPLNVEVIAPAALFGTVRIGMSGAVNLAPFFPGTHKARVVVVDKVIDAASGTLGIRLELPNPGYKIPAGIHCSVHFAR